MGVVDMSPARRSLLVQVFQQMDNTGNGSISIAEYRSAVASQTMLSLFEYLDAQGVADGEVTLDEWLKGMGALGANLNDAQFMKELKKLLSLVVNTGAFPPSAGLSAPIRSTVDVATPTIERCVAELSEAVEGLLAGETPPADGWDLDPVAFLAGALKRRNPARAGAALAAARAAAQRELDARPPARGTGAAAAPAEAVRAQQHAAAAGRRLHRGGGRGDRAARVAAGAVYSGGTRLALVGREGGGEGDDAARRRARAGAARGGRRRRGDAGVARRRAAARRGGGAAGARRRAAAAAAAALARRRR